MHAAILPQCGLRRPLRDAYRSAPVDTKNGRCGDGGRHRSRQARIGELRRAKCQIGTWNVRGGIEDKMNEWLDLLDERCLYVLCATEAEY